MADELLFRIVFIVTYGIFFGARSYFRFYKFRKDSTQSPARKDSPAYGTLPKVAISACILGYLITVIVYILIPDIIAWAQIPLPDIIRWMGMIIALLTVPPLAWIHITLGRHYSPDLIMKEKHTIVTTGPYSKVRHPMYTVLLTFSMAMSIISANLVMIAFSILIMIPFPFVARQEEQMLLDGLGEEYKRYMERTGRFFPPLSHKE
jgi:protein-S-isoprenylcysteine O-methyltransferase Ste14